MTWCSYSMLCVNWPWKGTLTTLTSSQNYQILVAREHRDCVDLEPLSRGLHLPHVFGGHNTSEMHQPLVLRFQNPVASLHQAQRMHGPTKPRGFEPVLFCRFISAQLLFGFACREGFKKGKNRTQIAIVQLTPICLRLILIAVKDKQLAIEQLWGRKNNRSLKRATF